MGLSISTTNIILGIDRTPARMDIATQPAALSFRTRQAKVNIHNEFPRVEIDQYECFATAGLKNNRDFTMNAVQKAYQKVKNHISKTVADGHAMAAIENGSDPLASIVIRDAYPEKEFGIDSIPKARPRINFTGGVDIEWERTFEGALNGIVGNYAPGSVSINYDPGSADIYVKQYPSISISYTGNEIDVRI